jgi:hypothetical protein
MNAVFMSGRRCKMSKLKVGQKVIVKRAFLTCGQYKNGDILEVEKFDGDEKGYFYARGIWVGIVSSEVSPIIPHRKKKRKRIILHS